MRWRSFLVVIVSQVCLITTACAGLLGPEVIAVETSVKPATIDGVSGAQPVTLRLGRYTDSRRDAGTRNLGSINATVSDMYSTQMVLGQDVADAVTAVLRNHFAAGGFEVLENSAARSAAFEVSGTILDFSLDVADRDRVAIAVRTTVHDGRDGRALWSEVVTERSNRFPGVSGDSKASITRYLNDSLATVANKTAVEVARAVRQAHPELAASPTLAQPAQAASVGRLAATTIPARAKVYVGDIYYGLSPLTLDLQAGVHVIRFSLEGFKSTSEKVSVRSGEITELEVTLDK